MTTAELKEIVELVNALAERAGTIDGVHVDEALQIARKEMREAAKEYVESRKDKQS